MILGMQLDLLTEPALIPVVRRQVDALLQQLGVIDEDVYRAGIVVTEACSNVVRHAYDSPGQRYRVGIECRTEQLTVRVTDKGKGFDICNLSEPEPGQIGGYGVFFIREAADKMEYVSSENEGTRLTAEVILRYKSQEARDLALSLDTTK